MPSVLDLMGQGVMYRSNHTLSSSLGMLAADTAVEFGTSVALGEVYGRWGDLPGWKGWLAKNSPKILGGTGKLVQGLLLGFVGPGFLSGTVGAIGSAGVCATGLDIGLDHARSAKGVTVHQVPKGATTKTMAKTSVGEIPAAASGHGLAWNHIQDLAASH